MNTADRQMMRAAFDVRESRLNSSRLFVLLVVGGAVGLVIGVVYVFSGVSF